MLLGLMQMSQDEDEHGSLEDATATNSQRKRFADAYSGTGNDVVTLVTKATNCAETKPFTFVPVRDNYNLKSHKYVCITTYQPDTKSNPNPNPNS